MVRKQICIIHGGDSYPSDIQYKDHIRDVELSYDRLLYSPSWKHGLATELPDMDILLPSMPRRDNAQYDEWKLWFDKVSSFLSPTATVIGHSLGGMFLAKYCAENPPRTKYAKVILIAPPYSDFDDSLVQFNFSTASPLEGFADEVHLMYSIDDKVVPISELDKYRLDLPSAKVHAFQDKGHFNVAEFPELLEILN